MNLFLPTVAIALGMALPSSAFAADNEVFDSAEKFRQPSQEYLRLKGLGDPYPHR